MSFVEFAACSSHQAATNIVKYLIQEHNSMSRVGVEPRPFDSLWPPQKRRSRSFGHAADMTKNDFKMVQFFLVRLLYKYPTRKNDCKIKQRKI